MNDFKRILLQNKAWAEEKLAFDEDYFNRMAIDQTPDFFWIGCSDSRVPANEVTGTQPGEIFVHRNIANLVVNTDLNMLSALKYSVEVLGVKHVIVCGHYGCGGVKAALTDKHYGFLNKWLLSIKDVYRLHREELDKIENPTEKTNRLVEFSVMEQINNLVKTPIIQKSWHKNHMPSLHGVVYDMETGILKEVAYMDYQSELDPIYKIDPNELMKDIDT